MYQRWLALVLAAAPIVIGGVSACACDSGHGSEADFVNNVVRKQGSVRALQQRADLPYGLASVNPTALPLTAITSGAAPQPTSAASTPAASATPSGISNAPALPNLNDVMGKINSRNYPPLDQVPPTDSPQVKQWIQDVAKSGVQIPNLSQTLTGGCPANPAAVADTSRCWWTCGSCVRDTDVSVCPNKLTWGLTYDDGPGYYTPQLLNYLDEQKLKATFFLIGSRGMQNPATIQQEYISGHQIGVHTWSHPPLTTLTNDQIIAELGWTKQFLKDVTGVTPLHFRPPYGDIDDRVRAICKAMNLVPIMWTSTGAYQSFDTDDFGINGGTSTIGTVLTNWQKILNTATNLTTGFIVLEHDLFQQTVEVATGYILPDALARTPKLTMEPVITCLGKGMGAAYAETGGSGTGGNGTNSISLSASSSSSSTSSSASSVASTTSTSASVTGSSGSRSNAGTGGAASAISMALANSNALALLVGAGILAAYL